MEQIITFKNTNYAIKAEKCLLDQKIQVSVLPLPSQISAGCGICLRVNQDEVKQVLRVLAEEGIDEIGLFSRVPENGQFVYTEIKDRRVLMEPQGVSLVENCTSGGCGAKMKTIDVLGKPCPIPVIEAKKALAEQGVEGVLVKVDTIVAVQNLEKMAKGYGYGFSYTEKAKDSFEIMIRIDGKNPQEVRAESDEPKALQDSTASNDLAVVISRDTLGEGAEELGKILIKGFIYSLTELPVPPKLVIFLNSGARLTSDGANTIDDLKKLEQKGARILTCGTCVNYYGLQDKLAVGVIADMFGITEKIVSVGKVINI